MEKMDSILDKAMKAGKKIELKKTAKELEMSQAEEAVNTAAAEMEKAAIEGNESAYAQAKVKRNAAENRLEILRIRAKNNVDSTDWINECTPVLKELEKDGTEEIRKMCLEFLSKYDELCGMIDQIDQYSKRYNQVHDYFKSHVLRTIEYRFRYMADILPIACIMDFKRKFGFQLGQIKNAVGK